MICVSLKDGTVFDHCPVPMVVALGSFDGVHLAHRALFEKAEGLAHHLTESHSGLSEKPSVAAWYFEELPRNYTSGNHVPKIFPEARKRELLHACGVEYSLIFSFPELRGLSPDEFIQRVLKEQCRAAGAVCGYNFRFGKGAVGTPSDLRLAFPDAFDLLPAVELDGEPVHSTRIRERIAEGDMENAARLLGAPFEICVPVNHGKHLGSALGFPTINQAFPQGTVLPKRGVYATVAMINGIAHAAVSNVGVRPTVDTGGNVNLETFLLDYSGDLYGKSISVRFLRFLREERKFGSIEALAEAIRHDAAEAGRILRENSDPLL